MGILFNLINIELISLQTIPTTVTVLVDLSFKKINTNKADLQLINNRSIIDSL
jgi:hypothetical protein